MKSISIGLLLFMLYAANVESRLLDVLQTPDSEPNQEEDGFLEYTHEQRIVGGQEIEISQTPYQAGLVMEYATGTSSCGGCLVSSERVLTSAHCIVTSSYVPAERVTVRLGSNNLRSGGITRVTSDMTAHPGYNSSSLENDIAIIRIEEVTFTDLIQPIALPSGDEIDRDFSNSLAYASGYGRTFDNEGSGTDRRLNGVILAVMSNAECAMRYNIIVDSTICTRGLGSIGTCNGDSGGPLVVESNGRNILIGVTSFVSSLGCQASRPAGFARVTSFLPFINSDGVIN